MTISTRHISAHFNQASATYDRAAILQNEIGSRLMRRLTLVKTRPQRILDVGCGTGTTLSKLAGEFKESSVFGLDIALNMTALAKQQHQLPTLCADMHALPLRNNTLDLIVANCALQWSTDPKQCLTQCFRALKPGGSLFMSSFGPNTLQELKLSFSHSPYEHVHQFTDMHDIGDICLQIGFIDPVLDREDITMQYPAVKILLKDLKHIGATNQHVRRAPGLMGKKTWTKMLEQYEMFRTEEGQYPASYEIFYCHATKPQTQTIPTNIQHSTE